MRHPVCLSVAVVDVPGVLETQLSLWRWIFRCPVFESYQICHRKPSHSRSRLRHQARGVMEPPTTTNTQGRDGADEGVTTAFISMLSLIAFCLGLNLDRQCLYYDCGWWLVAVIIPAPAPGLYQ